MGGFGAGLAAFGMALGGDTQGGRDYLESKYPGSTGPGYTPKGSSSTTGTAPIVSGTASGDTGPATARVPTTGRRAAATTGGGGGGGPGPGPVAPRPPPPPNTPLGTDPSPVLTG